LRRRRQIDVVLNALPGLLDSLNCDTHLSDSPQNAKPLRPGAVVVWINSISVASRPLL
jgi:hypothetical protein